MTDFKKFQQKVCSLGGVWEDERHVYFSQFRDGYWASYQPNFPEHTQDDCIISYNWTTKRWENLCSEEYHIQFCKLQQELNINR